MKYMYSVENIGEFKCYQNFIKENSKIYKTTLIT